MRKSSFNTINVENSLGVKREIFNYSEKKRNLMIEKKQIPYRPKAYKTNIVR